MLNSIRPLANSGSQILEYSSNLVLIVSLHLVEEVGWDENAVSCSQVYVKLLNIIEVRILRSLRNEEINSCYVWLLGRFELFIIVNTILEIICIKLLSVDMWNQHEGGDSINRAHNLLLSFIMWLNNVMISLV